MPSYTYKCESCEEVFTKFISMDKYEKEGFGECDNCKSKNLKRLFSAPSSKIKRSREEVIENAKEEARNIAREIQLGNRSLIKDIYGEK